MRIVIMSDIHLFRKTERIRCALKAAEIPDILLLTGDLADRAQKEQYDLLSTCIRDFSVSVPVYSVMGNHDNPVRDDTAFRAFEKSIHKEKKYDVDGSGAFYSRINDDIDIYTRPKSLLSSKDVFLSRKGNTASVFGIDAGKKRY